VPELPEAETIVRGLRRLVVGQVIERVQVIHADVLAGAPAQFKKCVSGRTIEGIERRGKNVITRLSGDRWLTVNLGMTGRLLAQMPGRPAPLFPGKHHAIRFPLEGGGVLVYDDIRRFGTVECLSGEQWSARSAALGPEPLGELFTASSLFESLSKSRSPVRSWLLDQRKVAGVGNIYANEALWGARIHPARPANQITRAEAKRLHAHLRAVLQTAIDAKGTTFRDYRTAEGEQGEYALSLAVYGQQGEKCPRCKGIVERSVIAGRSAFFCPKCQK
jgi:formamidopyrimidine-DNA glycosylase